ncbi:hypothetical protein AJ78_00587 [Emergomyces pasteurianus Ep9510]|uniref:EGF domain-specific O-linked N-acetylglucosamine transferase n=1 Tax=Emergomyces pasteurianus Ep9510 TaxID=1447872 RepID=A0A1J9QVT9_9EURO|nr:hypothetical protein AJ78_00587 [Emergomyces pasteurianus Ep9510]
MLSSLRGRRYVITGGFATFLFFAVCWHSLSNISFQGLGSAPQNNGRSPTHPPEKLDHSPEHTDGLPLVLSAPGDYHTASSALLQSQFCAERFDVQYLTNLAKTQTSYCDADSKSSMTCFHTQIDPGGRTDSFCISGPATFDHNHKRFTLDCSLRSLSVEELRDGIPKFEGFPHYWYETGPKQIFSKFVRFDRSEKLPQNLPHGRRNFSILIKREDSHYNVFHSLMEIVALSLTLDVMKMARNRDTNLPFFMPEDFANAQVIILDDLLDGSYFDLWKLFAKQPTIRLKDISASAQINLDNIIVPLPGGGNPFWQNHWEPLQCEQSELLQTFVKRVLNFYNIRDDTRPADSPLVLTFIDRKEKRRLIDQGRYIERLRAKFPSVEVNLIDLAVLPFSEQIKLIRRTDILAGVHGAGLTHGIFLPPHSTIAEILPPKLGHKGFRNMAKMMGHKYFSSHGGEHQTSDTKDDWQFDDVFIDEDRFMNLLELAVKSMYNRGLYNEDVS